MIDAGAHVIVGATSEIGRHVAYELARAHGSVIIAARSPEELAVLTSDLALRTAANVMPIHWEATSSVQHDDFLKNCLAAVGEIEGIVVCHGFLAEQRQAERDWTLSQKTIDINFTSSVALLNVFASYFESRSRGYICGISSVAGDRGRQSNYLYGAAKAAFSTYLDGLRNRLFRHGISVITVKPGFVDTSMTWGMLNPDSWLVASPERVARDVAVAIRKRKNVVYSPRKWKWIMLIIRLIPEWLFKRLRL
jgi:short-subunit dehydrogenase